MKKLLTIVCFMLLGGTLTFGQTTHVVTGYNYPVEDPVLSGLKSIRGMGYVANPFNNGTSLMAFTNYNTQGVVHVFASAGNDSLKLVWSSPAPAANGGASTPRYVMFGDLDNDGLIEVIYQSNSNGIFIYEWDGISGSYNFGTQPSQTIDITYFPGVSGNCEYMEIGDFDGDGVKELSVAYNSAPNDNDRFYVVSATGDWATDNPGFSGFNVEFQGIRTQLAAYGLSSGTPYAMIAANFDGTGNPEILLHNWNLLNVTPMRVPAADTYVLADTNTGKANYFAGGAFDDVALFGGMAYDIDGDGRDEVYLPVYPATGSTNAGKAVGIHYATGQTTDRIDSTNIFMLDFSEIMKTALFGYGYGDIDGNGKKNLYFSSSYPYNILTAEFQGGDKTNPANWLTSVLYKGDSTVYTSITTKDSLGNIDTIYSRQTAFVSKFHGRFTDFDNDGLEDIIMPYQALSDSITIRNLVFNSGTQQYDTTLTMVQNPKRYSIRVLERNSGTGIEVKELTLITPNDYVLEQNYPNPFNPETNIRFTLPMNNKISLKIYDVLGKEVITLINNQEFNKGAYEINWNGTNSFGAKVASGTYIAELKFGNFAKTIKMSLMK